MSFNGMKTPHVHVDEFLSAEDAQAMRDDFERHCASPNTHTADVHQVWNYWHVPPVYTYLRTNPEKIIAHEKVQRFHQALIAWSREHLGMTKVTWPYLSLYVDGCVQNLHNDSMNGRFGFVFSLTRNQRRTSGGETIVLREGDLFLKNLGNPASGVGLYDLIEPRFNRLAMFDDRMPHGVQRVEGSMDPLEGRLVMHGHVSEAGGFVDGPLPLSSIIQSLGGPLGKVVPKQDTGHRGPLIVRIYIGSNGVVGDVRVLVNRLAHPEGRSALDLTTPILAAIGETRFPEADGASVATVPLSFGPKTR